MNLGIYGASGFGKEIYDIALRVNDKSKLWDNIFFIDDGIEDNVNIYLSKCYKLELLEEYYNKAEVEIIIAIGEPVIRKRLFEKIALNGYRMTNLIDPTALVSPTAKLGIGIILTSFCSVASNAIIGNNVAVNVKSIIGHDIIIGDNTVISSMVNVGGACIVGSGSYLGMACQIKEGKTIGYDSIIGMGSVVHNDIPDEMIALGNPARPMRKNIEKKVFK